MKLVPIQRAPSDLSQILRGLADAVDAGDVSGLVAVSVRNGGYDFYYSASLHSCLVMASLLQQNCVDRMRA